MFCLSTPPPLFLSLSLSVLQMSLLNRNMNLLNHSLEDVQEMRERVASMGSVMNSYDASFTSYQRQIGDLTQANTDIKNDVIAADEKIKSFGVSHS